VIGLAGLLSLLWLSRSPPIATEAEEITISRQYLQMFGFWKRQEISWVFAVQFFVLIGLFGFIPHMSIWLTINYGLSASAIGLFYVYGGIGSLIENQIAGWLSQRGLRFSLIGIGSVLMGMVLMLSTQDLLPGSWTGAMFFGIMLGGSMRMPGLQTILIKLTGKGICGRLMAMSMIMFNMTMGLGGFWSTGMLSMEKG
jgi:predicted MFS family arabinose efflux permease